jgi:hypothetical protein
LLHRAQDFLDPGKSPAIPHVVVGAARVLLFEENRNITCGCCLAESLPKSRKSSAYERSLSGCERDTRSEQISQGGQRKQKWGSGAFVTHGKILNCMSRLFSGEMMNSDPFSL